MQFKDYVSKPIVRKAAVIPEFATIKYVPSKSEATVNGYTFKCHEQPEHGDYVVRLRQTDVYHCSKAVFEERNEV